MSQLSEYEPVKDETYRSDHPDVVRWTEQFHSDALEYGTFDKFSAEFPRSRERADAVGRAWYRFSAFMPWYLCHAAAAMPDNVRRHYVIQTAFEELGMRDVEQLHCEMFREAARLSGTDPAAYTGELPTDRLLSELRHFLLDCDSHDTVLGSLLGLEMPAVENIQTVFDSLAHNDDVAVQLRETTFFKLHFELEVEHVRLSVANFLRFSNTETSRDLFLAGFSVATDFWRDFWAAICAQDR